MNSLRLVSERQEELARVLPFAARAGAAERGEAIFARLREQACQRFRQRTTDRRPLHPGPASPPPSAA